MSFHYFLNLNYDKNELKNIINQVAEKIKSIISIPRLLITESEIAYNLKMAEALTLADDEGGVYYFKQNAEQLQKSLKIDKLYEKDFNATIPTDTFNDLCKRYLIWCKNGILEISPDLKEQVIARQRITLSDIKGISSKSEFQDMPF